MINLLIKKLIRPIVPKALRPILSHYYLLLTGQSLRPIAPRICSLCGYEGWFQAFGRPPRLDARCPECGSLERHRQLYLAIKQHRFDLNIDRDNDSVLHFAAEPQLERLLREKYSNYKTADLFAEADLKLDLEDIDQPSESYKLVFANHVLEHVDDIKASSEIKRILVKNGVLVAMVPLIEGWETTYENENIVNESERLIHFGQGDHVRYYGRDFRDRIQKSGLVLTDEITAEGEDVVKFGLLRGEKIFVFRKID